MLTTALRYAAPPAEESGHTEKIHGKESEVKANEYQQQVTLSARLTKAP